MTKKLKWIFTGTHSYRAKTRRGKGIECKLLIRHLNIKINEEKSLLSTDEVAQVEPPTAACCIMLQVAWSEDPVVSPVVLVPKI